MEHQNVIVVDPRVIEGVQRGEYRFVCGETLQEGQVARRGTESEELLEDATDLSKGRVWRVAIKRSDSAAYCVAPQMRVDHLIPEVTKKLCSSRHPFSPPNGYGAQLPGERPPGACAYSASMPKPCGRRWAPVSCSALLDGALAELADQQKRQEEDEDQSRKSRRYAIANFRTRLSG
ncbi:MAG: hypothetical protein ABFS46_20715 [Myxococcota bacterium]